MTGEAPSSGSDLCARGEQATASRQTADIGYKGEDRDIILLR